MAGNIVRIIFGADTRDAERGMDRVGDAADGMQSRLAGAAKGVAAAGVGLGAAVTAGLLSSLDAETASAKLQAQLGKGTPAAEQAGRVAGKVYAGAYGESLEQVGDTLRQLETSGALAMGATDDQVQKLTQNTLSLADAFGQDTEGAVNAVAQMMKTGLAPNADAALDILAKGFQNGNDKAGDLLDTFNEYGTQFRKLGLDGQQAMGLIQQGLKGGARDADLVADSLKEFSIRAVDGSKTTIDGFKSLGLNAEQMAKKIAAGGKDAAGGLDEVLDRLRGIKDPVERSRIAVELFGTQAEDMGAALNSLDLTSATTELGKVEGAAQGISDTLGDTVASKLEASKRGFEEWKNSIVGVQGPLGDVAANLLTWGGPLLETVSQIGLVAIALKGLGAGAVLSRIGAAAAAVFGIGTSADTAAAGGVGRLAGALKFAGIAAGIYVIGGAIDDMNVKAAGGAENLTGQAKELHGFFQLLHGDLNFETELTKTQTQWDQTVENFTSGRAPIVEMFNNIGQSAQNIFKAMGQAMSGDFAGAVQTIQNNAVKIPGTAHAVADNVQGSFRGATNNIVGWWDRVRAAISQPIGVQVIASLAQNSLSNIRNAVMRSIPHFHTGGTVPGTTGQETLAVLKAGERVIPPGGQGGGGGPVNVTFVAGPGASKAVAALMMELQRTGEFQVR
jgi:minor tail protein